jgi:Xaa-Pro aminopeptidase
VSSAPFQAYTPIVAAGKSGSTLHYIQNNAPFPLNKSALLLVDAGCEYSCYASDVTRTYPLNGKFEKEYKTLYEIVLKCQLVKSFFDFLEKTVLRQSLRLC